MAKQKKKIRTGEVSVNFDARADKVTPVFITEIQAGRDPIGTPIAVIHFVSLEGPKAIGFPVEVANLIIHHLREAAESMSGKRPEQTEQKPEPMATPVTLN